MAAFEDIIAANSVDIHPVVDFDITHDLLFQLDLTQHNSGLTDQILSDTDRFSDWVDQERLKNHARYAIGGYGEHRSIYSRSAHFDAGEEPRRFHLGVDIWAAAGTPVYNFSDASVHSFAFNNHFGDYGATIILGYKIAGLNFHVLYGHLSLASLKGLYEGQIIPKGAAFATFGIKEENGYWPPHLHMQVITDLEGYHGDYPGVCKFSEREKYLANCPDPNIILRSTFS